MTWKNAVLRIHDEGFLDGIPEKVEVALNSLLTHGGELYQTVKSQPDVAARSAAEYFAIATECAVTAVALQQETLTTEDWPAASRLLLGDGLLTLAFHIASRHQDIDLVRFSAVVSQLLGEEDPANRIRELIEHEGIGIVLNDTTTAARLEE